MSYDKKFAAQVAVEIIERAEDGTKLLAVHHHYPKGGEAFKVGFYLAVGFIAAATAWVALTKVFVWLGGMF